MRSLAELRSYLSIPLDPRGCWKWNGGVDTRGYGHLSWNGRTARAHRLAYQLMVGPIPRGTGHHGICVRHSCDNKLCCNPEHLVLGTHADNMNDMKERGGRKGIGCGADNGRAKLSIAQVIAIRADHRGKVRLSREYGVSPAQIQRIRAGKQWAA